MRHLSLVPPLAPPSAEQPAEQPAMAPAAPVLPAQRTPYEDEPTAALAFFQVASGICLCRECTKQRHPAYGLR